MVREHGPDPARSLVAGRSARQIRMRIVALARAYRAACDRNDAALAALLCDDVPGTTALRDEEERAWEAMDQARNALFSALEELDTLEGAGP